MNEKITVLVVEPGRNPYTKEIYSELEVLQKEVGGYLEVVYPFDDPVCVICDEEGKLKGYPLNRALYDDDGSLYDIIAGTFLIAGLTEDDFGSLTEQDIERFSAMFRLEE